MTKTLGIRNNNPLNIRYNSANDWMGQTGHYVGFCVFSSKVYGVRAGFRLLKNYNNNGYNTIEKILNRFAPASENNTESYINYVCQQTGYTRHQPLSFSFGTYSELIKAMAKLESRDVLTESELHKAYALI